ncbi:HTH domain-containing protein, partial [Clostridium perfringens]|nr:HTH domain-containing protein [Clostridium perfringens]
MQKIERIMAIILALKKNKKMIAKELADTFEVDIRTIYRDIQALSEMNIPIISYTGSEGGY